MLAEPRPRSSTADAADRVAFVEEVGADDVSVELSRDAVDCGMLDEPGCESDARLLSREVDLEVVRLLDRLEGLVDDAATYARVGLGYPANPDAHDYPSRLSPVSSHP